jgi:hypothetical protein
VHLFDEEDNVIIMDDCGMTAVTLKQYLLDFTEDNASVRIPEVEKACTAVGHFIRQLHTQSRLDLEAIQVFDANEQGKDISAWVTYGRIMQTLTGSESLELLGHDSLNVSEEDLKTIEGIIAETTRVMLNAKDTAS